MRRELLSFRAAGLQISLLVSVVLGWLLLAAVLTGIGLAAFNLSLPAALGIGLLAGLLHYGLDFVHHLGHSLAARSTGYPMRGIRFWGVLGTSLYPPDEGVLPAGVHIRRALGGPLLSAALSLLLLLVYLALSATAEPALRWLLLFLLLDNTLVLTIAAFVPTPLLETDGSTILAALQGRKS